MNKLKKIWNIIVKIVFFTGRNWKFFVGVIVGINLTMLILAWIGFIAWWR
jgi:hypothetical protein